MSKDQPSDPLDDEMPASVEAIAADPQHWIDQWEPLVAGIPNPQTALPGIWTMLCLARDLRKRQQSGPAAADPVG